MKYILSLRQRMQNWFEQRLPLTDTVTLSQRSVYILPTRPGWMLGVTLLVLLAGAINYQLNLGYLLTFLLGGCAVVGMMVNHETLRGLELHVLPPQPQYANHLAVLDVILTSTRRSTRYGIGVSVRGLAQWVWTDVPAQGRATVQVGWKPDRRGLHRVPTLTAETRFPMGTFRVWTVWRPAAQILVYPEPEAHPPPLPPGQPRSGAGVARQHSSSGEYDGVRAYRRGDALKHIVWKKVAKSDQLVSREQEQFQAEDLWLDFATTSLGGEASTQPTPYGDIASAPPSLTERKLSRLCAWVLMADKRALSYGLRLPGIEIAVSSGDAHRRQCLEALAKC